MASTLGAIRTAVYTALAATSLVECVPFGLPFATNKPYGEFGFTDGDVDLTDENSILYVDQNWSLVITGATMEEADLALEECMIALVPVGSFAVALGSAVVNWIPTAIYPPMFVDDTVGYRAGMEGTLKIAYDYTP